MLARLIRDENGQDMIEYGLLGSFISVAAILTLHLFADPIQTMFNNVLNALP